MPFSEDHALRITLIGCAIILGFALVLARYSYLALMPSEMGQKLRSQAAKQFETEVTLAPPRAEIHDRNGKPLAISLMRPSLFMVPKRLPEDAKLRREIAKRTGIPVSKIDEFAGSHKSFAWLKRRIEPDAFAKLGDLSPWREFIGVIEEPKRVYPERQLAAHLIGFVGLDNVGLEGVEAVYNQQLNGETINARVMRDARGRLTLITPNGAVRPEPTNKPLNLSIDLSVQAFAEEALQEGVINARAHGGSAVVMDISTGELLAIASYPTYDLNTPPQNEPERRRFRPLMDALELGSVVKPLFVAKALERGVIRPNDTIYCENGTYPVPGGRIRDDHPHGLISIGEVVKYSSNICTYKIVQRMGRNTFREAVQQVGLARPPGTGLPGEWRGYIAPTQTWREMRFANMAFGQGLAVSPLQITRAISTITGGGVDKGVRILAIPPNAEEQPGPQLRYISSNTSRIITNMMASVVEEEGGTGGRARIPGVSVAGKTGTAQKFSQATRSYSERIASFVGVLPAESPRIAITVVIDEPQVRPAYGGTLAGPVFSSIGEQTIRYLNSLGRLDFAVRTPEEEEAKRKENLAKSKKHNKKAM